jgi:excisionase family DNA binding protein
MDTLLTVQEAARLLRLSPFTVYRLAKAGRIPSIRIGGSVRVPKEALEAQFGGHETEEAPGAAVLVIEDDPLVRDFLREVLEAEGRPVHAASNGNAGLHMLRERKPSVVFLDIKLPDMSGVEVLSSIAKSANRPAVAIVTGYAESPEAFAALQLGPQLFLRKPLTVADVLSAMHLLEASHRVVEGR